MVRAVQEFGDSEELGSVGRALAAASSCWANRRTGIRSGESRVSSPASHRRLQDAILVTRIIGCCPIVNEA